MSSVQKKTYRKVQLYVLKPSLVLYYMSDYYKNIIKDFAHVAVSSNYMATKREQVGSIVVSVLLSSVCIPFSVRKQTHMIFIRAKITNGNL